MPYQAKSPSACLDQHMSAWGLGLVITNNVHAAIAEVTDPVNVSD